MSETQKPAGPYRAVRPSGEKHALCYCTSCKVMARLSLDGNYPYCAACKATRAPEGHVERPTDEQFDYFESLVRMAVDDGSNL